jgi:hypothetical protein
LVAWCAGSAPPSNRGLPLVVRATETELHNSEARRLPPPGFALEGLSVERKKLCDILRGDTRDKLNHAWGATKAAEDSVPLPAGDYIAHIVDGTGTTARTTGPSGYKLTFKVIDGDHAGRLFWHDVWLTEAALPMAKRDLGKLGITSLDQLDAPIPKYIRCKVKLALRKDDDGIQYNRVRSFDVLGIDTPAPDPFAPPPASVEGVTP